MDVREGEEADEKGRKELIHLTAALNVSWVGGDWTDSPQTDAEERVRGGYAFPLPPDTGRSPLDRRPVHQPPAAVIVVDRVVHGAAVVPDGEVAGAPAQAAGEFGP